jgi:hypothetical protein
VPRKRPPEHGPHELLSADSPQPVTPPSDRAGDPPAHSTAPREAFADVPRTQVSINSTALRPLHGQPKDGLTRAQQQPNPFPEYLVALTDAPDGPTIRLWREVQSRDTHYAAIEFPTKPGDGVRQQLKDAGFSWSQADGVWKLYLREPRGVEHRRAQEVFESVANELRAENGCPPLTAAGQSMT